MNALPADLELIGYEALAATKITGVADGWLDHEGTGDGVLVISGRVGELARLAKALYGYFPPPADRDQKAHADIVTNVLLREIERRFLSPGDAR